MVRAEAEPHRNSQMRHYHGHGFCDLRDPNGQISQCLSAPVGSGCPIRFGPLCLAGIEACQSRPIVRPFAVLPKTTHDDFESLLERDFANLGSIMTAREFSATGLAKSTHTKIESLIGWISEFALDLLCLARRCSPAIESKLVGEIEGWSGHTILLVALGNATAGGGP